MPTLYSPLPICQHFFVPFANFFIDLTFFRCYSMFRKLDMEV
nr:MAG TPA: hypothetical protein [Caudoviricetes sp.]